MNLQASYTGNVEFIDGFKPSNQSETAKKKAWEKYSKNGISILFSGIVYNSAEIFTNYHSENIAENLFDLYEKESYQGFYKINGKATIIIIEKEKTIIFRDQWGEGPTVFYDNNGFATRMEAILKSKENAEIDKIALNSFMKYGFIPAPLTIIDGIFKVPAGHVMIYKNNIHKLVNLFDYKEFKNNKLNINLEDAVIEYDRLLKNSIHRRIAGCETVGALLSGGYDSGGNIAVLREVFDGPIKTYSIGFRDNPFSELPYAKLMAEKFDAEHHEYLMDFNDIQSLPDAIKAFGEPFSESGFMLNNQAMRFVMNDSLPVIIGGDGNDQMMGTTGKELALHHLMRSSGLIAFQKIFAAISNNNLFEKDDLKFKLRFHNQKILNVMRPDNFGFNNHQMKSIFKLKGVEDHFVFKSIPKKYKDFNEFHDFHNYHLDIRHSINEVILNKASRLSAYYGNNLAFSYIDKDIYDFVKQLPLNIRLKGSVKELAKGHGITKYIHKAYTKPKLPDDITSRKKQGGFSPLAIFFTKKETREKMYKYISNSGFSAQFTNENALKAFFRSYEDLADNSGYWFWFKQLKSNQLINLLIMSLWWDIYCNNKEFKTLDEYLVR